MITEIKAKSYSLIDLYDAIAEALGEDPETCRYDCRKVHIAPNLQQCIYDFYIAKNPNYSEEEVKVQVTMLLVISGPQADKNLKDNAVEVFDGFIQPLDEVTL